MATPPVALLALFVFLAACVPSKVARAPVDSCLQRRAAFDIGSAATKLKVADVDVCSGRIVELLLSQQRPVFYRDDVERTGGRLSDEVMSEGITVLRKLKTLAGLVGATTYAGVATAAFRLADNGEAYRQRIERELGVPLLIISQESEARLGFDAAVARVPSDIERVVVWDVGGGSMQMMTYDGDQAVIYQGQLSSTRMRDHIIGAIKGLDPETIATPNPLTEVEAEAAIRHAEEVAAAEVPVALRARLSEANTVVVGMGTARFVTPVGKAEYEAGDLERDVRRKLGATDAQIGGDYASTHLSDRLLIAGFMRGLGIRRVRAADVNLCDGLLRWPADRWPWRPGPPAGQNPPLRLLGAQKASAPRVD